MGEIQVNIELVNQEDEVLARKGHLAAEQIRSIKTVAVVDTGAIMLAVPVEIADALGLEIKEVMTAYFADGRSEELPVAEGIRLRFPDLNLSMTAECVVLPPGSTEILIGQIPLERLDLLADCKSQKLLPRHPGAKMPVLRV